jgi:outer membrane protein OmpA-like peptidoglycan-associated protein/TPR repeat protein
MKRDSGFASFHAINPDDRPALPARTVADKYSFPPGDHDSDGIDDEYDLCPYSAEDGKEPHPFDGCAADVDKARGHIHWPDLPRVVVKGDHIEIAEQIHFAEGSAKILDSSKSLIAAIAQAILDNSEIELVEVAGHADKKGDVKANLTLTNQRAKSVVDALVAKGVSKDWLRSGGYGEYCPLDPAQTKEAFAKNRRVEFRILRRDGRDLTPTWGGCDEAEKHGIHPPPMPPRTVRPKKDKPAASLKGIPDFHGSCRTRTPDCEKDCRDGSDVACYVGAHERSHVSEAPAIANDRDSLKKECDAGLFPACSQLAVSFLNEPPQDHATALSLAAAPCDRGDGLACGVEGFLLERGCSVPPDASKGFAFAKKGCAVDIEHAREHGSIADRLSCEVASSAMWWGFGGAKDHASAYSFDQRACASGLPHACLRLGQDALSEPALVTDRPKLVATLHDACEQEGWDNKRESCIALSLIEKPGEYPSPKMCEAGGQLECFKMCETQNWEACMDLYISAIYKGFYRRFDSLAPRGMVIRGLIEEAKIDKYKDSQAKLDEVATEDYSKACSSTIPSGCINHARMRLEGRGTFRDPIGASKALDEWCVKGEKMACALLGHAAATKKIPGGPPEAQKRMAEACKAGLARACVPEGKKK